MPYRIASHNPCVVQHRVKGKWKKKQECKSAAAAEKAINLLRGIDRGFKPTRRKAK